MAPRETLKKALRRTVQEELGITIRPQKALVSVNHVYTHFRMTLHAWQCVMEEGDPKALGCEKWRKVEKGRLSSLPFSRGDRKIVEAL